MKLYHIYIKLSRFHMLDAGTEVTLGPVARN